MCYRILFLIILSILSFGSYGQINTPSGATVPFGSNTSYPNGMMPTNLPSGGTYGQSQDAADAYNQWKTDFIEDCADASKRVKWDTPSETVSEGIGYGMLLAAYAADKSLFDGLWEYYKQNMNANGVMDWHIDGCSDATLGSNGASDAEVDAAMALIVADYQWPDADFGTTPHDYDQDAVALIEAIGEHEIAHSDCGSHYALKPGDNWCSCWNASYQAPSYYRCYKSFLQDQGVSTMPNGEDVGTFWDKAIAQGETFLDNSSHGTSGLVSNWNDSGEGLNCGSCNGSGTSSCPFGYDASRAPWRGKGMSVLWYGSSTMQTVLNTQMDFWIGDGGAGVVSNRNHDGSGTGDHVSTFIGPVGAGALGASNTANRQQFVDDMYAENRDVVSTGYFNRILRMIGLFVQTGNFWNPCNISPSPDCSAPDLGSDQSICGKDSIVLHSGLTSSGDRTFEWRDGSGTTLAGPSTSDSTYTVTSAGKYKVIVDSAGCVTKDSVNITSSLSANLGPDVNLCSPAYTTLDPGTDASYNYTWTLNGDTLTGYTDSSEIKYARTPGEYIVLVETSSCSDRDTINVTSDNPTPVDKCRSDCGTLTLEITDTTGGPYDWYDAQTGGTKVATDTTQYTTSSICTSDTFYVEDNGSFSGSVGPTSNLGGGTNWGVDQSNQLEFTAYTNFTINSMDLLLETYSTNTFTVHIDILNNSGTVVKTDSAEITPSSTGIGLYTMNFSSGLFIDQSSWGSDLRMRINDITGSGNPSPYWNSSGASYPYNSSPSGVVDITGSRGGDNDANDYMYFYNWQISSGSSCDRLPVVAQIGNCNSTQPVTLADFSGEVLPSDKVELTWTTLQEKQNDYFLVQRSANNKTFKTIGKVNGQGTQETSHQYSYTDPVKESGTYYYRLKQVDLDGSSTVHRTISVRIGSARDYKIYPNPSRKNFRIRSMGGNPGKVSIKITDLTGKTVLNTRKSLQNHTVSIGKNLEPGTYIIKIIDANEVHTHRVIKQ